MKRVIMLGCGGAGKSTMARRLGELTGLPVVHLDKLYWRENWTPLTNEEFDALQQAELQKDCWIMDGNFGRTLSWRLERCDTIIYLDYPRWQCVLGVLKRILTNYGRTRPDMGPGCKERFDWEFLCWVWNFNRDKRDRFYRMIRETNHAKAIILRNRKEGEKFLRSLENPSV